MDINQAPPITNKRYDIIERLGAGGMGAVFRAHDRLTGHQVAFKRVLNENELPQGTPMSESLNMRVALSYEFRALAGLRHPNIVSVVDYGFIDDAPFFTMNLVDGARTLTEATETLDKQAKIDYLVSLLQGLIYLHRRGILHRDLKPTNILVDKDNTVKILDFGLSVVSTSSMTGIDSGMAGTLSYMSPELFMEEDPSVLSDMYAFGVVAYELFTRNLPFANRNFGLLINSILNTQPDFTMLDDDIEPIIKRLLAKSPADRYQSAEETLHALCEATNTPMPPETTAIRESFLQTSRLIGRQNELRELRDYLDGLQQGIGALCLVGGESGVGKSRLLEEVRVRALITGVLVMRGQTGNDAGSPYRMWRDVLSSLILYSSPTETEASVLKEIMPDIERLLDTTIPDATPLPDATQTQTRLFNVITDIVTRYGQPMLVLLEDLQWAGGESIELLQHLQGLSSQVPILIVGDYRNDEAPQLSQQLGNPPTINLNRLNEDEIRSLSTAMLGSHGDNKQLVDLLQHETDGNAFFVVEVIRALAEDAGNIANIGTMTLPQTVFAKGIQDVILRRLARVSDADKRLLQLAAIIGRRIDENILANLAPDSDIDAWLTNCSNAGILEIQDEKWQFAHAKLRESMIEYASTTPKAELYQQVADAVEATYPDDVTYAGLLANLYYETDNREKERDYAMQAGQYAYLMHANAEAIQYLEQAKGLIADLPDNPERTRMALDVQVPLSVCLMQTRGFSAKEVEDAWIHAQDLCETLDDDPAEMVSVMFGLCGVYLVRGDNQLAVDMDTDIINLAPRTEYPEVTMMQGLYTKSANLTAIGRIKEAYESINELQTYEDEKHIPHCLAIYGGYPVLSARAWKSFLLQVMGYPEQALAEFNETLAEARKLDHPFTLSTVLTFSWFHHIRNDPTSAYDLLMEGNEIAKKHGFTFDELIGSPAIGWAMVQKGYVQDGLTMMQGTMDMLAMYGIGFLRNYFLVMLAETYIQHDMLEEAMTCLTEADERVTSSNDKFYEPELHRVMGNMLALENDYAKAEERYQHAIDIASKRGAKLFELRSAIALARLKLMNSDSDSARQLVQPVYDRFDEGFDTEDLVIAHEFLTTID